MNKHDIYLIKKYIFACSMMFVIITAFVVCANSNIYADEINSDNDTIKDSLKVTDELYNLIQDTMKNIKTELNSIDEKLQNLKNTESYEKYPAVRLNVDTPVFGIVDITNNKLKITSDVTGEDVKNNYSIRDILKTNTIKMPSYTALSIVVITRDVEINKDMSYSDASTIIFKLIQYQEQVINTSHFVDSNINSILSGYIESSTSGKYAKINAKLNQINNENAKIVDNLNKLELFGISNIGYYQSMEKEIYIKYVQLKDKIKDLNLPSDELQKLNNNVEDLRVKTINFSYFITEMDEKNSNTEILNILQNLKNTMESEIEYINGYIEDSKNVELSYNTTSKNIVENMRKSIDAVDIYIEQVETNNEPLVETSSSEQTEIKATLDYNYIVSEIKKIYTDFLIKENTYINDNINLLLIESKTKVSTIVKYTLEDVFKYVKYTYFELPSYIKDNSDTIDNHNIFSLYYGNNKLKEYIPQLIEYNFEVGQIYNQYININNSDDMNRNNNE